MSLRRSCLFAAIPAALALAACGAQSGVSAPAAVESSGPAQRLTALTALDQRVARVAWRLSQANAELCPVVRQSAGWALHAAGQYSPELRPVAESRFGLKGDLPGVLSAPEGSPAAAAGLGEGDLILSVNGADLAPGIEGRAAQFEGLQANIARLDAALAQGPVRLKVRRGEQDRTVTVQPARACGYDVQLNPSDELNARADGRRLFISTALAGFAETDDELAVILGHELAHNVLRHRRWSETGGEGRTVVGEDCDPRLCDGSDPERQADRVGLYLSARAGYRPDAAAPFWRRFGASNWRVRYPQLAHASAGVRARRLEAVQAEIEGKVAAGQRLLP
jgi:hypothetical protein